MTDPDSAIVSDRGKLIQGYNVQAAVCEGQLIVAVEATAIATDHGQLVPMLTRAREQLTGVGIEDEIGTVLADSGYWNAAQVRELQANGVDLLVQPRPYKPDSRLKSTNPLARRMAEKLSTGQGAVDYRRRQQIVEPVFAHIKHLRGITRVLRRGRAAVQAEIDLIATTHNLLKLYRAAPTTA